MTEELWQRDEDFVGTKLENSFVILNMKTAGYYAFNVSATDIWELLGEPRSCAQIAGKLTEKYDVSEELCAQSVARIVEELRASGLVHLAR